MFSGGFRVYIFRRTAECLAKINGEFWAIVWVRQIDSTDRLPINTYVSNDLGQGGLLLEELTCKQL